MGALRGALRSALATHPYLGSCDELKLLTRVGMGPCQGASAPHPCDRSRRGERTRIRRGRRVRRASAGETLPVAQRAAAWREEPRIQPEIEEHKR
jgi:hypothetical protein